MNYAIRSGIGITATFAISQTSRLLKTIDNSTEYQELHSLQERLDSKIRIITPAIDLIDLISSRGNTTLESAVTLTKAIRWDIQSLGIRLSNAATAEEVSRRSRSKVRSQSMHEVEIRQIIQAIRKLLTKIEDAVPLINLAITTSGASLSTKLPASVSPSRLLQASTFLTAGDHLYSTNPNIPAQVGPTFTLSLYMLFAGHIYRAHDDTDSMRDTTWKEVIHKARVKLVRVPLRSTYRLCKTSQNGFTANEDTPLAPLAKSVEETEEPIMLGDGSSGEYAYHLDIVEDFSDDRVHSFEDDDIQPGPYDDVELAGIREELPIYQISKIFYADTGKILNIGSQGEANNPVLLLKRDVNALPPRRMMEREATPNETPSSEEYEDHESQNDIDQQIRKESIIPVAMEDEEVLSPLAKTWRLPLNLDPEWMALEVYTEAEESSSEDEQDVNDDSAYVSHRPSSSGETQPDNNLAAELANLKLEPKSSPSPSIPSNRATKPITLHASISPKPSPFGHVRTSLSLLEMLIRLTALQQFQQASHLAIPDELLTFFLEESSTTGVDGDERRRTRRDARRKVGFDPYDESPVKKRGEDYQYQSQDQEGYQPYSREGTTYTDYDHHNNYDKAGPGWLREQSSTPKSSPEPWLLRSRDGPNSSPIDSMNLPSSSPLSPYRALPRKGTGPLERLKQGQGHAKTGSPLGRGMSVETDSTLGTSPGSPSPIDRKG